MNITRQVQVDVLVIGAGGAGLRAALAAAEAGSQVLLTNKGPISKSGITLNAGGGMQAPFHPEDSSEQFFLDILKAGYGLSDQNLAKALAEDACARALDAEQYGARITSGADGKFTQEQFPGQSKPRNIHFIGGGIGLVSALTKACRNHSNISILDNFFVTGLLESRSATQVSITGAIGLNLKTGELMKIEAKAVVLATGGCQWLWEVTDCPTDATGDGIIYAYRAGAEVVDMEMVLFYPTVIVWPPSLKGAFAHYDYLDSEILDGNVYDKDGIPVLPKPLSPRNEAMRIMAEAISVGRGSVHGGLEWYVGDSPKGIDMVGKKLDKVQYHYMRAHGVEPTTDRIQVAPGAHYLLGGIHINEQCRTTVQGLFATPECAGNFDGADRLGGSGLAATQVFGARAGLHAHDWATTIGQHLSADLTSVQAETDRVASKITGGATRVGPEIAGLRDRLRSAVQRYAGVNRDEKGLCQLMTVVDEVQMELAEVKIPSIIVYNQQLVDLLQLEIMCETARLVAGCALMRTESRGHHFRADFPKRDDVNWLKHTLAVKGETGAQFSTRAIVKI